jgi:hypothetical protein
VDTLSLAGREFDLLGVVNICVFTTIDLIYEMVECRMYGTK